MNFSVQELVDRARTYVDDDHGEEDGWISPERWMSLVSVEYAQLYKQWVRMGLIAPPPEVVDFTGPTVTVPEVISGDGTEGDPYVYGPGVLTLLGVAEITSNGYRPLRPAQAQHGRDPWWTTTTSGPAEFWKATADGDVMTITIDPADTGTYELRYIPVVDRFTELDATFEVPFGCDERLVLGVVRRAKIKEGAASAAIERLIADADAQTNFLAFGRMNSESPKVRRAPRGEGYPTDPFLRYR